MRKIEILDEYGQPIPDVRKAKRAAALAELKRKRFLRAVELHTRALRRLKLAKTLERKYRVRVRYYRERLGE